VWPVLRLLVVVWPFGPLGRLLALQRFRPPASAAVQYLRALVWPLGAFQASPGPPSLTHRFGPAEPV